MDFVKPSIMFVKKFYFQAENKEIQLVGYGIWLNGIKDEKHGWANRSAFLNQTL